MLRVCGALEERTPLRARACWCRGVFCGKGGFRLSREWRKDFRGCPAVVSRSELELVMSQADLYDGDARREKWRARIDGTRSEGATYVGA